MTGTFVLFVYILDMKVIGILGQTATGKTDLSIEIASLVGGEVVSVDSRQLYRGMDIGTAKIQEAEKNGIPHHMIDILNPGDDYSVVKFQEKTRRVIEEIGSRGKVPLLVGGTGYYFESVLYERNYPEGKISNEIEEKVLGMSPDEMVKNISLYEGKYAEKFDMENMRKARRILMILMSGVYVPENERVFVPRYDQLLIGLSMDSERLRKRIHDRNVSRLKNGLVEEVIGLHKEYGVEVIKNYGLEYLYVSLYLEGEIKSLEELILVLDAKIWQYAKRQRTWFRKDPNIWWVDADKQKSEVLETVESFAKEKTR